jgi:hypothetical protein
MGMDLCSCICVSWGEEVVNSTSSWVGGKEFLINVDLLISF